MLTRPVKCRGDFIHSPRGEWTLPDVAPHARQYAVVIGRTLFAPVEIVLDTFANDDCRENRPAMRNGVETGNGAPRAAIAPGSASREGSREIARPAAS